MPRKVIHHMADSILFKTTLMLLENRPHHVTYAELSKLAGVSEAWIEAFSQGRMNDPSVVRVEKLYNVLAAAPLELPDEL